MKKFIEKIHLITENFLIAIDNPLGAIAITTTILIVTAALGTWLISSFKNDVKFAGTPVSPAYVTENVPLVRIIDDEAGVVCWAWRNTIYGGLSCLPIKDTKLSENSK